MQMSHKYIMQQHSSRSVQRRRQSSCLIIIVIRNQNLPKLGGIFSFRQLPQNGASSHTKTGTYLPKHPAANARSDPEQIFICGGKESIKSLILPYFAASTGRRIFIMSLSFCRNISDVCIQHAGESKRQKITHCSGFFVVVSFASSSSSSYYLCRSSVRC